MKEERMAILRMLENGMINADEAERLLNALHDPANKSDISDSLNNVFTKTGSVIENLAQNIGKKAGVVAKTVGEKAEEAKPEIKKAAKTVKEKAGEAAESIRENVKKKKAEDDIFEADFTEKTNEAETDERPEEKNELKDIIPEAETHDEAPDEDGRDYEAEFNKMMEEANGGDILGDAPVNDALFEAQKEWEEMKETEEDGDMK